MEAVVLDRATRDLRLLIGSGCFFYWFRTLPAMRQLESALVRLISEEQILDGLEISADAAQLEVWRDYLQQGKTLLPPPYSNLSRQVNEICLSSPYNVVHLPDLKHTPSGKEEWLAECINVIYNETGISEFTIHPDQTSLAQWERLIPHIPVGAVLSVENMDRRKRDSQTLREIALLLDRVPVLHLTLDICHWMELGRSLVEEEFRSFLERYSERVSKIHFSVPTSYSEMYGTRTETYHYLMSDSGYDLPDNVLHPLFECARSWVIEGVVPVGREEAVVAEAAFIRNSASTKSGEDHSLPSNISHRAAHG